MSFIRTRIPGILILFFSLAVLPDALAQFPPVRDGSGIPDYESTPGRSQEDYMEDIDTFGVFSFTVENINRETPFSDSLLTNFQQYDPVRQRTLDYKHLGNLGSAHQYIVYEPIYRRGFDIGLHEYDLYMTTGRELPYYRLEKAYTNLFYTQGAEQADGYLTAQFSRNFANGLNFTLDYKKISELGTRSHYPNQNSRNTALAFGMWYHSDNGRYDAFLSHAANTIEQENNGGIEVEPAEGTEFESLNSADVFLEDGDTRRQHREWLFTHYYKFGGQRDSIKGQRRAYTIAHQASVTKSIYKYSDPFNTTDTSFYNLVPEYFIDDRGMRHYLEHQKIENSLKVSTFKAVQDQANVARDQRDLFEVGLVHSYHDLQQEPLDSILQNLFLTGKWNLRPGPRLRLETYGHFGLLANRGDYRITGELFVDLNKIGKLSFKANNQLYEPNLLQYRFFLSKQQVWENNFNKTLETNLSGTYTLPKFNLVLTAQYHLLNNYIYFDTAGIPQQTGVPISIAQAIIQKDFRVGPIHLDNVVALQQSSEEEVRVPTIYSKHSLYYAGKWFKVLNVRLGVDVRFNDAYFANYYNPASGQFQLQNDRIIASFPAADAYFSMRVTTFRAFFKYENISSLYDDRLYYQTAYYAYPAAAFRIGIKWRLVN